MYSRLERNNTTRRSKVTYVDGMDFGYSADPSTLLGLYKYNDAYIFDEVIYQKKLLNIDISNLLKQNNIQEIIYADSAEPKSIAELKSYRHKILPCTKVKIQLYMVSI